MAPETPAWVQRWQQSADEELLYVDQALRVVSWPTDEEPAPEPRQPWQDQTPEEEYL